MIQYPRSVVMAERNMEIVQNREKDFPYVAMVSDLNRYPGNCTPWHWHDHFEIVFVERGCIKLYTQRSELFLKEGEGYFVNANVLHRNRSCMEAGAESACMHAQLFTRDLISGTGLIARKYLATVENCVELEALKLTEGVDTQGALLREMRMAFDAAKGDAPGYELLVSAHLSAFWAGLFQLVQAQIAHTQTSPREDALRLKAMLSFIYENYMHSISVRQIADAAGICERECFRCFHQALGTTPMLYLTQHRVTMAARILAESHMPVGEVAEKCGFSNSSYFGKVFRQIMNCAPREYRKKNS